MIVFALLGVTLLLAVCSLLLLRSGGTLISSYAWHRLLAATALATFVYLYGTWVYLSVYIQYLFGFVFLLLFVMGVRKKKNTKRPRYEGGKVIANLLLAIMFGTLSVLYFTGTAGKSTTMELQFPLRHGQYIVLQGGKGLPSNLFHYGLRGAVFAMDIARLNTWGNRANKIFSKRLEDYEIFDDTVFSPCSGKVTMVHSDNPDNIPPNRERGPSNTNMVLIETDVAYILMAHFKHNSVFVREGMQVTAGQPLGLVGNSGFSMEPHLHLQAHTKTDSRLPWYRQPQAFLHFDGRGYLLFQTIDHD